MTPEYKTEIARILGDLRSSHTTDDQAFQKALIQAIVECFHLPYHGNDVDKAQSILSELFGFSLEKMLIACSEQDKKSLFIELLYGLYYGGINLAKYEHENLEFLVIQVLAEKASIQNLLSELSLDKTLCLICFLFKQPREGTFKMLKHFDKRFTTLIFWLKRNYFSVDFLKEQLKTYTQLDEEAFTAIIANLQTHAQEQTKELYSNFQQLVSSLYASITQVYKSAYEHFSNQDAHVIEAAKKQEEQLKKEFERHFAAQYTLTDFQEFTCLFGLYGYPYVFPDGQNENTCVVEKVKNLCKIITGLVDMSLSIASLAKSEMQSIISFTLAICSNLYGLTRRPLQYKEGMKCLTFSLASFGKDLANEVGLESILEAGSSLCNILNEKKLLSECPIVVFDQSDDALFVKNEQYINDLNKFYKSTVLHISKHDALILSRKTWPKKAHSNI